MKPLSLFDSRQKATIMCVGAHSDDIEIGCGGTILKILEQHRHLAIHWVVLSAKDVREQEARASAAELLADAAEQTITVKNFRNGYFPYVASEIKDFFESLKAFPKPDTIFCHSRQDLHQDHRLVGELAWNTFRDHLILEYEIPKYDADLASPNVFSVLTEQHVARKADLLERHFTSQRDKQWFSSDTFRALCRLRGIECNSPTGFAEAFYGRKVLLG